MTQELPDQKHPEHEAESPGINITRRDALIGAVATAVMGSFGTGAVKGEEDDSDITVDENINFPGEGSHFRYQFEDGNLNEFNIESTSGNIIMELKYDESMEDDYIFGDVALSMDDHGPEVFGEHTITEIRDDGGEAVFTTEDFEEEGYDAWGDGSYDFSEIGFISDGYEEVNVEVPEPGDENTGVPRNKTEFELRFRIISASGSIDETETVNFTIDMTPPLGYGVMYGVNYGKDRIEEWEDEELNRN